MKISIIIPAYNEEESIADTIKAALAQDYSDFEVIVVDNASTDRTVEIASEFPVRVVSETRKGLLYARECGRMNASGDIIANIDADCLPEADWLSRGSLVFEDPEVVAVTGPYDYYDGTKIFRATSLFIQKYIYSIASIFIQSSIIKGGAVLIGGNNLIRSETLRRTNGYNTDIIFYGEDTDTAKRVSKHGRVVFDKNLIMKTSARRFKAEGTFYLFIKYLFHFFKTLFSR